jgi:hypothetical protein
MRVRISPQLEHHVHHLATRQGRSDQEMLDRLISAGLQSTGMPAAAIVPPMGEMSDAEMSEMKIPLNAAYRAQLRALAAEHGRSQRRMATMVVAAGLRALGADHDVVDEAVAADLA